MKKIIILLFSIFLLNFSNTLAFENSNNSNENKIVNIENFNILSRADNIKVLKKMIIELKDKIEKILKKRSTQKHVTRAFYVKTKLTNNFSEYKSGFGDNLKDISLNKLEIIDDRTALNGLRLFSKDNLSDIKIRVLPCKEMPMEIDNEKQVLGDCFEIDPGTIYEFSKEDFLVFPRSLFDGVDDDNFEYHKKKAMAIIYIFELGTQ